MLHRLLLCTLLLSTTATYTMETINTAKSDDALQLHHEYKSNASTINATIYSFFDNGKITDAAQIIDRREKKTTSLLVFSCNTHNKKFIQWVLNARKPLFDAPYMQRVRDYADFYQYDEFASMLDEYVAKEKKELEEYAHHYAKTQSEQVAKEKARHKYPNLEDPRQKIERWQAEELEKDKQMLDEKIKATQIQEEAKKTEKLKSEFQKDPLGHYTGLVKTAWSPQQNTNKNDNEDDGACRCIIS